MTTTGGDRGEAQLLAKYAPRARVRGGELLLRHRDALEFVDDCARLGLVILGLDFYRDQEGAVVPLLSSADYSDLISEPQAVEKSTHASRRLLENGLPHDSTWVSFVVDEPRDANP